MSRIELVVFDVDGTLCDLCGVHRFAFRSALASIGVGIDSAMEAYLEGRPTRVKLRELNISGKDAETVLERKQELTLEGLKTLHRDPDKIAALLACSDRKKAVYSNAVEATVLEALGRIGILSAFNFILTNEEVRNPKPDPEGYVKVMEHFGIQPDRTLILEDSEVGMKAAIRSGAFVNQVEVKDVTGPNMVEWLKAADEVIN